MTGDCTSHGTTTDTWTFTYDGDGVRVKEVYSGTDPSYTKYFFAGGAYEVYDDGSPTPITTRYYAIAGMMVAMKKGTDSLKYFAQDHLSSTSIVMNASGGLLSQNRYLPFGEVRDNISSSPITQTDFGYTGQRNLASIGLMDYDARFYSPTLMRFIQPDTIVPDPLRPQSFNRYSYVLNNPLIYIDPTGLKSICMDEQCFDTTHDSYKHISTSVAAPPIQEYWGGARPDQYGDTFCERNPNFRECREEVKDDNPVLEECTNSMQDNCIPNPPPFEADSCYYNYGLFGCPENRGKGMARVGYDWSRVPKDELAVDVIGLIGDVIMIWPAQLPAEIIEGAQVVNIVTKLELISDAGDIYIAVKEGEELDVPNLVSDIVSLLPAPYGPISSGLGVAYDLSKGIVIEAYP